MRREKRVIASTHRDAHGDRILPEALLELAERLSDYYVPIHIEHDRAQPPVGRLVQADVKKAVDGELILIGTIEYWEDGDSRTSLEGEKHLARFRFAGDRYNVACSRNYLTPEPSPFVRELARLGGRETDLRYFSQKAVDPVSIIVIGVCAAAGSVAGGFFGELGADMYSKLKEKLVDHFEDDNGEAEDLLVHVTLTGQSQTIDVEVLLDNALARDIETLFEGGFETIDAQIQAELAARPDSQRFVFRWKADEPELLYSVRLDGVPSPLRIAGEDETRIGGFSLGSVSELGLEDGDS